MLFSPKKIHIVIAIAIIALSAGGYLFLGREKAPAYNYISVERRDLVQEVSVTGRIKPAHEVELAFERSGRISGVQADVGDKVGEGQTIATLGDADLEAQLEQAKASVRAEEARLRELQSGMRQEEIEVQRIKVSNAKTALEDAQRNVIDRLQDAYTKSDDAIHNKVDQIFSSPEGAAPKLILSLDLVKLQQLNVTIGQIEDGRFSAGGALTELQKSTSQLTVESDLNSVLDKAQKNLDSIKNFLDKASAAINSALPTTTTSQGSIDSWRADISTARTNLNTAITNLSAADEKLRSADSSLALARQELVLSEAGAVPEQILAQQAKLDQALANVKSMQAQVMQAILVAPFNGTVTKQDAKVGGMVTANTPIAALISEAELEIEANVPEADIAKIKIQSPAKITLDAYGSDVEFPAKIMLIDPAATLVEGVATYKTTLEFLAKDTRIKSGMTADIEIIGERRTNVIAIPQRAVIEKDGEKFVLAGDGKRAPTEKKIVTGLRGSDGYIEITSGLSGGEKIVASGGAIAPK